MTQLNAQQREARASRVGASEVSALTGSSKYHTPADVARRILLGEQRESNEAMRIGSLLEDRFPPMLKWRGMVVRRCHRAYVHPDPAVALSATPDFYAKPWAGNPRGLVEAKVSSAFVADSVPPWWEDQIQVQLGLAGRQLGYLAVLNGSKLSLVEVPFDPVHFAYLVGLVREFTESYLVPRIIPPDPEPAITMRSK